MGAIDGGVADIRGYRCEASWLARLLLRLLLLLLLLLQKPAANLWAQLKEAVSYKRGCRCEASWLARLLLEEDQECQEEQSYGETGQTWILNSYST